MNRLTYEQVVAQLKANGCAAGVVNPTEYHAWKGKLAEELGMPVTSKSDLADFAANRYAWKKAKDGGVRKSSPALELGSLVDCLVLTPELFDEQYLCEAKRVALKKDGTPYANGQQDPAQKAEWEAAAAAGKRVLSPEELERGRMIAAQATAHMAQIGLVVGETCDTQVGLWVCLEELDGEPLAMPVILCAMLDCLPHEGERIVDLKTTSKDVGNESALVYHAEDFWYGAQAAMYIDLYNLVSIFDERREFSFLFVGTSGDIIMSRELVMLADSLGLYRKVYYGWVRAFALAHKEQDFGTPELEAVVYAPSRRLCAIYNEE